MKDVLANLALLCFSVFSVSCTAVLNKTLAWQRGFPWRVMGDKLSAWCVIGHKLATWGVIGHSCLFSWVVPDWWISFETWRTDIKTDFHVIIFVSTQRGPWKHFIRADLFKDWYIAMLTYCNSASFPHTTVYFINCPGTKVARYLGIIFSLWFVFSRGMFVVLIDINTAPSVHLTKGYCIQWGNCKPGGKAGWYILLGIFEEGVLHGSPNPDTISDQKSSFSTPIFRPERGRFDETLDSAIHRINHYQLLSSGLVLGKLIALSTG